MSMLSRLAALGGAAAPAGLVYVGGTVAMGASPFYPSLTALTGGIAARAAIGDLVLVIVSIAGSTVSPAVPTVGGYTQITTANGTDTNSVRIYAGYKVLTAADSLVSVSYTSTNGSATAYVSVWRNFDTTYPFDVQAKTASSANSVLADPPAISPITAGAYVVAAGAGATTAGTQTYGSADLTNFLSIGANATYDSVVGGGYKQWTSGSFNPGAFTHSGGDTAVYSWAAVSITLRPAGVKTVFPTVVGSNYSNLAGTVTVPAHQAGDWVVFVNGTTGTTFPPALTSGFTNITTFTNNNTTAAEDKAARAQYIISDGTLSTLSCSTYGGVVILRNVTSLVSSKAGNASASTASTTMPVTYNPFIPGSLCIFAGYDPDNYRSISSGALTTIPRFGGYAYSGAIVSAAGGSLLYFASEFPAYFAAEFI